MNAHLKKLGIESIPEYKNWCRDHGFSTSLNKTWEQHNREHLVILRQTADIRRAQARREQRNPHETIQQIFAGQMDGANFHQPHLQAVCRAYKHVKSNRLAKQALLRLLLHVQPSTNLINRRRAIGQAESQFGNTFVDGLTALAFRWPKWIRDVEQWKPRTHNDRRQFTSLARHLIAEYDVPEFMDAVWFKGTSKEGVKQQNWFIHIAQGRNIRTAAKLPIPLTKRMAHHLLQAPSNFSVEAAIRWGQIHGLGGDARLAHAICETRLCESFDHDDFWQTVLRFLIDTPMLDTVHIAPMIDYLHHQRFVGREMFVAPGVIEDCPPEQPNLCMKGRNPQTLLRQVRQWHQRLGMRKSPNTSWAPSGIGAFEFVEGNKSSTNMKRWTIRELLSSEELREEGRKMRHCVASYSGSCARHMTSIWTLEMETYAGTEKLLTIEVRPRAKQICQARGKCNERPSQKTRAIMSRWASLQGLSIASYV